MQLDQCDEQIDVISDSDVQVENEIKGNRHYTLLM
jgi:hypothetical protein